MNRFIFMLSLVFSSLSMAATISIPFNDVDLPQDKKIGSTTAWKGSTTLQSVSMLCKFDGIRSIGTVNGILVPGYTDVYQTSNPGIGVRYRATAWHSATTEKWLPFNSTGVGPSTCDGLFAKAMRASAQFIIVGKVTPGPIISIPTAYVSYYDTMDRGSMDIMISGSPTIKASTCEVDGNIDVKMPSIGIDMLPNAGSIAGRTSFNIGINCDPLIAVHMVLTDAQNPGNTKNVMTLSADSEATGIGYQILRNSNPINFGPASSIAGTLNQFKVVNSTGAVGGRYIIPLDIQYYRTASSTLGVGSANASAIFTMSYQ